jgi:hypothetical protein
MTQSLQPSFANLANPSFRLGMMQRCVATIHAEGSLWYPLLNVISTFIDGLASGPRGGTRAAYLAYVKTNMPSLDGAVGAEVFYDNFRNAAVHEFSLKPGYAIGRDAGLQGKYAEKQQVAGVADPVLVLNIDMLHQEFSAHLGNLVGAVGGKSAP